MVCSKIIVTNTVIETGFFRYYDAIIGHDYQAASVVKSLKFLTKTMKFKHTLTRIYRF